MNSIRQRLLLWLIAGMLVSTGIAGLSMYWLAQGETDELFDYQIRQIALSLPNHGPLHSVESDDEDPNEDNVVQVWDAQGKLLFVSYPSRALPHYSVTGLHTVYAQRQVWRVYNTQRNERFIQIAQPMTVREELAADLAIRMLIPFFVLIPLLAGLIWWVVGRSLCPLRTVAMAVSARHADAMQDIDETDLPQEIAPVVVALNQLLARLNQAMQAQKAFIADAAHELRSPLTALKLQVQLTERAGSSEQRSAAFAKLNQRLDRTIHMVKQLLDLARSEPRQKTVPPKPVDFSALVQETVQDFLPLSTARQINMQLDVQPGIVVSGCYADLRILVANLVDNAIRYTHSPGLVQVRVVHEAGRNVLYVIDNGNGIPESERERVFDRFYRREGTDEVGSGLGLAIVRNIAEAHQAVLTLSDNLTGHGLAVMVSFR